MVDVVQAKETSPGSMKSIDKLWDLILITFDIDCLSYVNSGFFFLLWPIDAEIKIIKAKTFYKCMTSLLIMAV